MQTIYYSTSHFIRHEGNLVDLNEFRRKLDLTRQGSLAPQLDTHCTVPVEHKPELKVLPPVHARRSRSKTSIGWLLDACASLGVVIMTLSFAVHVLI